MDKQPKRRKYKDNPYELSKNSKDNTFIVKFKDSRKEVQIIEISEEIYNVFDKYELIDISEMNEYDNHIEHLIMDENTIYNKSKFKEQLLEDVVLSKILCDEIFSIINSLPDIQKRRLKMYYFDNMTYEEIAKLEGCTKRAIKFSIDIAISKILQKIKK